MSYLKLANVHFGGVVAFICFNYFLFVYGYMVRRIGSQSIIALAIFHILFLMMLWSMGSSILSDPGRVPIYWGFFAEENQHKKRRYCLLCHSFKPQRCHHCSTCQRCVLNMDHHCPWISNCVGHNNRKFFMLLLFYIILTLTFCICCEGYLLLWECLSIVQQQQIIQIFTIIRTVGLVMQAIFFVAISSFFKFHVQLILSNSSTLDNLERKRTLNIGPNMYDVGPYQNFEQVFGPKAWLWPFPVNSSLGNGVIWPQRQ